MDDEPDGPEELIDQALERLARITEYHSPRQRTVEGHTLRWCRECQQDWPCPTAEALDGRW